MCLGFFPQSSLGSCCGFGGLTLHLAPLPRALVCCRCSLLVRPVVTFTFRPLPAQGLQGPIASAAPLSFLLPSIRATSLLPRLTPQPQGSSTGRASCPPRLACHLVESPPSWTRQNTRHDSRSASSGKVARRVAVVRRCLLLDTCPEAGRAESLGSSAASGKRSEYPVEEGGDGAAVSEGHSCSVTVCLFPDGSLPEAGVGPCR